jgi:hypothetical protein
MNMKSRFNPLLAGDFAVHGHFENEFEKSCLQHALKCASALCSSQNYLKLLSSLDKNHFYIHVDVSASRFVSKIEDNYRKIEVSLFVVKVTRHF